MYANFFKNYLPYQPPLAFNRVQSLPPVSETELLGQLLDWASQYLYAKKFPLNLITILLKQLKNDVDKLELDLTSSQIREEEKRNDETRGSSWYNAHESRLTLIDKVDDICLNFAKNYESEVLDVLLKQPFHEVSFASVRNCRRTLEDRFSVVLSMEHIFDLPTQTSYFAVYDGHNGSEAANYSAAQLHINLIGLDSYPEDVIQAITEACHTTDDEFLLKGVTTDHKSGTTLALTLFVGNKMYVAWVGDSQVVVFRGSSGVDSIVNPHKPGRLDEIERIKELGGEVTRYDSSDSWRVNGCLAVSRAIGDPEFKKFVIPTPDVVEVDFDGTEEYVILATDGLWDDISPAKCHKLIINYLITRRTHEGLSFAMTEEAKNCGATDNITVVIVFLRPVSELITKYGGELEEFFMKDMQRTSLPLEKLTPSERYSEDSGSTPDSTNGNENSTPSDENEIPEGFFDRCTI